MMYLVPSYKVYPRYYNCVKQSCFTLIVGRIVYGCTCVFTQEIEFLHVLYFREFTQWTHWPRPADSIPPEHDGNSKRESVSQNHGSPSQQHLGIIHTRTYTGWWLKTLFHDVCFVWPCVGLLTCLDMAPESNNTNGWASIMTRAVPHPSIMVVQEGWHTTRTTCQTKNMLSNISATLLHNTLYPFLENSREWVTLLAWCVQVT